MAKGVAVRLLILAGGLLAASGATAAPIECGAVLVGGRHVLEQDLVCPHTVQPALTLIGATLDMARHTLTCDRSCVYLLGRGSKLLNGAILGGLHESILVAGEGRHLVRNVVSSLVDRNIVVTSDYNVLHHVFAASIYSEALDLRGHGNRITRATFHCRDQIACVAISGTRNRLLETTVVVENWVAVAVSGDTNVLEGNRAIASSFGMQQAYDAPTGFLVSGRGNTLTRNVALDLRHPPGTVETLDLVDASGDCTTNTWTGNFARTRSPACLE